MILVHVSLFYKGSKASSRQILAIPVPQILMFGAFSGGARKVRCMEKDTARRIRRRPLGLLKAAGQSFGSSQGSG